MPVRDVQFWRYWAPWFVLVIGAVLVIVQLQPAEEERWLGRWSAQASFDGTTLVTRISDDFTAPKGDYWRLIDVFLVAGDQDTFLTKSRDHRPAGTVTLVDRFPVDDAVMAEPGGVWNVRIRRRIARDEAGSDVVSDHQWLIPIVHVLSPSLETPAP